jgi:centrosomal protein CEP104
MYFLNESPLENYFPQEDNVLHVNNNLNSYQNNNNTIINDQFRQFYEFIPYHPVSTSSEMVGTTIEELLMHNFPTKNSWENSRLGNYPEEVIVRLNHRSDIKFILLRAKINRPIPVCEIYIGDGIYGNFNDTKYIKLKTVYNVTEDGTTIPVDGIGNYIKLVFTRGNIKIQSNPFGQISIAQLKFFGKKVNHLIYYNEDIKMSNDPQIKNDNVDKVLIEMGLPIQNEYNLVQDQNYEISPVDEETKITIRDLLQISRRAELQKDYEILRKIKKDIRLAFYYGNEILNCDRQLKIAKSKEDFDTCIKLRRKREELANKRDNIDMIYETSRYENMILLSKPTPADLLADEENRLLLQRQREERERLERERLERERLERERLERERLEREKYDKIKEPEINTNINNNKPIFHSTLPTRKRRGKFDDYVSQNEITKKEQFMDELQYNQGDKDLEPFFVPRARNAGGIVPTPDINKLRRALRQGVLTVTGVRLYSSLIGDDWKMREAAVRAFLDYIENPLNSRYLNKTFPLFQAAIEISKLTCDDKVIQIYLEGLKILQTCLAPPVCGNDIDPTYIQKSVKYFLPIYIKKISEFNDKQRDLTLKTVIDIFRHPALNVGELVKACLDIVENNDGVTPDKQPWNILLARLEIILRILDEYGINEDLWDWYNVFVELIIPSLFHQKPDCRLVAEEICVILYKMVGSDIRNIINDLNNLKPNLKDKLNNRFNEVDIILQREQNNTDENRINSAKKEIIEGNNNLEPIIEAELEKNSVK